MELERKIRELEKRVVILEQSNQTNYSSNLNLDLEQKIIQKIDDIGIQHLVLLSLKLKHKQSKHDLKSTLETWNKPIGMWFDGGNLRNRLLKTSVVLHDGKNDHGEDVFSLGTKGLKLVKKLITKYELDI